jgi:uncharacterized protein with LGFP repeats
MTAIAEKWGQIPWIGAPVDVGAGSQEGPNPDGRGSSRDFESGSIYWTPNTGAHEVHGAIRDLWSQTGWEGSFLRCPVSDEMGPPDNRNNRFQGGHVTWAPAGGPVAHHSNPID